MTRQRSTFTGGKELEQILKRLPKAMAKRELDGAVSSAARVVAKEFRRTAPRGDEPSPGSEKYGPLNKNIRVKRLRRARASSGTKVHTGKAFWGLFLEFGTVRQAARPWFRSAFQASAAPAFVKMRTRLATGLAKQAKALAGRYGNLTKTQRRDLRR